MSAAPERTAHQRGRSLAASLGLTLASLLATLVFVELLLTALFEPVLKVWQVREIFRLDPELIYSLEPGAERVARSAEFVEHVKINRDGLRDDEVAPRSDFEQRILVLGDSMVFGHGVDDGEAFPNQLEALFRAEGRRVDVINAGVKGYGTDAAYKLFTSRLLPLGLEPDLVIFGIYLNDLPDNIGQPLYTIEKGALSPLDPTRNWIYLLGSIEERMPGFVRSRILTGLILSRFVGRDIYGVLPDLDEEGLVDWSARKALLEVAALERMGRREGFEVMVLCIPYRDGPRDFYAWLDPVEKLGVELFNPSQEDVWRREKQRLFFDVDYHFTPAGNRLLAEMLHTALTRSGKGIGSTNGPG